MVAKCLNFVGKKRKQTLKNVGTGLKTSAMIGHI